MHAVIYFERNNFALQGNKNSFVCTDCVLISFCAKHRAQSLKCTFHTNAVANAPLSFHGKGNTSTHVGPPWSNLTSPPVHLAKSSQERLPYIRLGDQSPAHIHHHHEMVHHVLFIHSRLLRQGSCRRYVTFSHSVARTQDRHEEAAAARRVAAHATWLRASKRVAARHGTGRVGRVGRMPRVEAQPAIDIPQTLLGKPQTVK